MALDDRVFSRINSVPDANAPDNPSRWRVSSDACSTGVCACARPCARSDTISPIMQRGAEIRFKRGEVLWNRGDDADFLLAICVGFVKLSVPSGTNRVILDVLGRGSLVGVDAALTRGLRPMRCVALSSGRAVRLHRDDLAQTIAAHPELLDELFKVCCHRTAHFAERMARVGDGSVAQRIAQILIALSDQFGLDDARGRFVPLRLTRGDLADLAGCRTETAIRQLSTWRTDGVVDCMREGIVIYDEESLRETAEPTTG